MKAIEKELRSCPFCGGEAKIEHIEDSYLCYAICTKCHATAQGFFNYPGSNSEEKSVHAWNRRVGELPAADVQEVKHGYWQNKYRSGTTIKEGVVSSCCDMWNNRKSQFCPNCGARMDGEER